MQYIIGSIITLDVQYNAHFYINIFYFTFLQHAGPEC